MEELCDVQAQRVTRRACSSLKPMLGIFLLPRQAEGMGRSKDCKILLEGDIQSSGRGDLIHVRFERSPTT